MDYPSDEPAPVYFIDDLMSDDEQSDPELYSNSSASSSTVDTLASSQLPDYFTEMHGRMFPADSNVAISLPTDSIEVQRCTEQHQILKAFIGSNYWGPVEQVLATTAGQRDRKKVLDMVTAEGSWVQEMAEQFPHVDFLSLDNVPLTSHAPRSNIEFEVYDFYNGIAAPDASFDMVHLRLAMMHLTNPKDVIRDIYRVLKPGGLLLFADTEMASYNAVHLERTPQDYPWLCAGFEAMREGLARQGVYVNMGRDVPRWLSPESDLWAAMARRQVDKPVGFRNIAFKQILIPAGPWPTEPRMKMIGSVCGRTFEHIWRSMEFPLRAYGMEEQKAKNIVEGAVAEIMRPNSLMAVPFYMSYAFKI
ncbi:methyltransferase domain protein [Ceratobasidium sp. AG-Ba]|nr:methyltransferase domain protein [Ceratobasidium sp. AG-Ba]